jgi:ABC-type sugar transport system permease subunit
MQIALVLNVIYVFNSFPIIWIMTNGGPANRTDILITYVYKQAFAFGKLGNAAAGSMVMFAILLIFAIVYLFLTKAQGTVTMTKAKKSLVCWALLSPFLLVVLFPTRRCCRRR